MRACVAMRVCAYVCVCVRVGILWHTHTQSFWFPFGQPRGFRMANIRGGGGGAREPCLFCSYRTYTKKAKNERKGLTEVYTLSCCFPYALLRVLKYDKY